MLGTLRDRSDIRDSRVAAERVVSWVRLAIASSMAVIVAVSGAGRDAPTPGWPGSSSPPPWPTPGWRC